ncbi:hypothetical protein B0J13DRAFT_628662 [Dactylonectria estremocensis]|uniref:Uncharacterized protein n=1 Tax=Dactylonectria estremocensis TaxID=1079267 RepID=A0A9P9DJT9_9HYPO|nr:hypothetical protein B0J13DRAFT_628662 [Dactylonectria estremocensis]
MAVQDTKLIDENGKTVILISSEAASIYDKPMQFKDAMSKSELKIEIVQDGVAHAKWGMVQQYKKMMKTAVLSEDTLKASAILNCGLRELDAEKNFPDPGYFEKT